MRPRTALLLLAPALAAGCAARREAPPAGPVATLASLREVAPDVQDATVSEGLDHAMEGYRRFLEETPETAMTPEAMRRLADLQLEKRFGIRAGDGRPRPMAAPEPAAAPIPAAAPPAEAAPRESDLEFERRTTAERGILPPAAGTAADAAGALEAIALYDRLLTEYPAYEHHDQVLYQKARAYDEIGRTEEALETMERLIRANPSSEHYDEVQFRRGEYFFTRRRFRDAEAAYSAILGLGTGSEYHELALYKLGWTLYKQERYEEALHRYMGLLDYKVSVGYDFDQAHEEEDEKRVADTYRVISLSFTNLGGPEAVGEYFAEFGHRSYEDRVYDHLGEHYLAKLRYDDAAKTYRAFTELYPLHRSAPRFGMRIVETFTRGGFPMLVLEAKRDFASRYGLKAEYWRHFRPEDAPEVLAYLKANLQDLATHYHAHYQGAPDGDEKLAAYREALRWYGGYLDSFPQDPDTPPIHYRMADLILEHRDFGEAARQYERTAYGYPAHPQAAAAGYAAVFAYRQQLEGAAEEERAPVRRAAVDSSLRFADAFPGHEQAPAILGAAADDLYGMKEYAAAVATARRVLDTYPGAGPDLRRAAWLVVAHGSFELADYAAAEQAYIEVLAATPEGDEGRASLVDNLAASIYKQGELAGAAGDYRAAADHFLRIRSAAPTSAIRATAEYDAGAALMSLQDWTAAAEVLEAFRSAYPEHALQKDTTRQLAFAYREGGQSLRAAEEYERLAAQSEDPAVQSEALLLAGDLFRAASAPDRALAAYRRYVDGFPEPVEPALETRSKIAEILQPGPDEAPYLQELAEIVRLEAGAGPARNARTRTLAARAALVLAEGVYRECIAVKLRQPFETSLQEKKQRMDATIEAMDRLVAYEIADVTAAATWYMAQTYLDFSRALAESERPTDLPPAEMAAYEQALDEEAFPFEEKAIGLHEKNLEMLHAGVLNAWTEKSLGSLAELVPGRYARQEASSLASVAIAGYVYRSPVSEIFGPTLEMAGGAPAPEAVETTGRVPAPPSVPVVDHVDPR